MNRRIKWSHFNPLSTLFPFSQTIPLCRCSYTVYLVTIICCTVLRRQFSSCPCITKFHYILSIFVKSHTCWCLNTLWPFNSISKLVVLLAGDCIIQCNEFLEPLGGCCVLSCFICSRHLVTSVNAIKMPIFSVTLIRDKMLLKCRIFDYSFLFETTWVFEASLRTRQQLTGQDTRSRTQPTQGRTEEDRMPTLMTQDLHYTGRDTKLHLHGKLHLFSYATRPGAFKRHCTVEGLWL